MAARSTLNSYSFFLIALFIVGLGFAMLQIAANPYVTILGPEATASIAEHARALPARCRSQ